MSDAKKAAGNTIQIVLLLGVALLAMAGAAWVFLDADTGVRSTAADMSQPADAETAMAVEAGADDGTRSGPGVGAVDASGAAIATLAATAEADVPVSSIVESSLRKARMAADADILIEPWEQSAVFFYSEALAADPADAVANAELDAVIGRLTIEASAMVDAEDFLSAHHLAQKVASVRPDHELVSNVQQALNSVSGGLVAAALDRAEQEDEAGALARIAEAEALPGQNAEYLEAVRDTVAELLAARKLAKAEAAEERREAAASATAAWMASVRAAIDAGRLTGTGEDSALALLKQRDDAGEISKQLRSEWLTALLAAHATAVNDGQLEIAETLLTVAEAEAAGSDEVARQRRRLEDALAERESRRVISVSNLVAVNRRPAAYPRRAEERDISGWVEVEFRVGKDGATENIRVTAAEPEDVFDKSVINAVSEWTFEPREFRGRVIAQNVAARLVFQLE